MIKGGAVAIPTFTYIGGGNLPARAIVLGAECRNYTPWSVQVIWVVMFLQVSGTVDAPQRDEGIYMIGF